MIRTIAIDVPALCEGNLHKVDVPLFQEVLNGIRNLKNVELLISDADKNLLSGNSDYTFTGEVWKFLSDIPLASYDENDKRENLTHTPNIIDAKFSKVMQEAIYLQLCVLHVKEKLYGSITFVGFIPRFSNKFLLKTIWNKKTKKHPTIIISNRAELISWTDSCVPHLDQKKHKAVATNSSRGQISPFSSYYKYGEDYANRLLQQAYLQSKDDEEFPHYLYTWDAKEGVYVEFRHENHQGDPQHNYHGRDMMPSEYFKIPKHIRSKYHQ